MKYDDASWHYGGNFPDDLPSEAGATHIGMFLAWAFLRGLGNDHEHPDATERLRRRELTGAELLMDECDEKFTDNNLSDDGNDFALAYYGDDYLNEYDQAFAGVAAYRVVDTWENFEIAATFLDSRYAAWRAARQT